MQRPLKICLVSQQYPPDTARGGIGTQTWNKAAALVRLGHSVTVVSRAKDQQRTVSASTDGRLAVCRVPVAGGIAGETYEEAIYWVRYAAAIKEELERLFDKQQFDVVNFPEWGAEGYAYLLNQSRRPQVPAVVHLHGPLSMFAERIGWPALDSMLYHLGTAMEDLCISRADRLMASSAHIAEYIAQRHHLDRSAIDVVHTGIDCDVFRPPAQRGGNRPTVLYVGNIARNKGITFLFEAVLTLRRRYPNILLRIVGGGGDDLLSEFRHRARHDGAEQNFEFCGFVPRAELPAYYGDADVFASPAEYELGVANVYVEAMACGCPVIAGTAGGAAEAVTDSETGILIPPGDVDRLVEAIDQIVGDANTRERMSLASRRRAEEYFALDRYIARVLACYERAIDRAATTAIG